MLAALQGFAKAHEVIMLIGLVNIVQQAIQRALMRDGILLGLIGAELSLGGIFFIISQEFRAAFSYGVSDWRKHRNIFILVWLILLVCILSLVVGPASAVLMVPKLDWFFEQELQFKVPEEYTYFKPCYPYIQIDPRLGGESDYHNAVTLNTPFFEPIPDYWGYSMFGRNHSDTGTWSSENKQVTHQFRNGGVPVTVNSSTSWNRSLDINSDWKGETNFSTALQNDVFFVLFSLIDYEPALKNVESSARFVVDITGIDTSTVCRKRQKLSCNSSGIITDDGLDWCFKSVTSNTSEGPLLRSQDLLLLSDGDSIYTRNSTKFWITEGPRTPTNNKFTDTIVFVLYDTDDPTSLVVCSNSATLDTITASSYKKQFDAQQVQTHGDLYYFKSDNKTAFVPPKSILYHENWLDMIYHDVPENATGYPLELKNNTYPRRNTSQVTRNPDLKAWATGIKDANETAGFSIQFDDSLGEEAGMVEIVVGGAFITILSRIMPSYMQYTASGDWNSSDPSIRAHYPAELMPEGIIDCQYINQTLSVYHLVYGYNAKSTAIILSMVVLFIHCGVAVLGSLWQIRRGSIIREWNSVPEYGMLFLGTDKGRAEIRNTCAGIGSKETLQRLVVFEESK